VIESLSLPVELIVRTGSVTIRRACIDDLRALMRLLSDDPISASRGDVNTADDEPAYARGLERVIADPSNDLVVAEDDGRVVGMLQLTVIPGLARRGSTRLLVEAVRVAGDRRSAGIGGAMMRWVMDAAARATGSDLVQLTSDAARTDAHRFYTRLGFVDSHVGFKYRVGES